MNNIQNWCTFNACNKCESFSFSKRKIIRKATTKALRERKLKACDGNNENDYKRRQSIFDLFKNKTLKLDLVSNLNKSTFFLCVFD